VVAAPHGKHPPWFRNLYKQAFRNFQALEGLGPLPLTDEGEWYSPLKHVGGVPQLQISWKIWEKNECDELNKPGAIVLSGKLSLF
jgi:hypothetical protein